MHPILDAEALLRLAEASGARFITTRNLRYLAPTFAQGVTVWPPREFLRICIAMTTLRAAIPDDLHEAVLAQVEREHISVDALISRTLRAAAALPGAWLDRARAGCARELGRLRRIMARVPDAPPVPGDER